MKNKMRVISFLLLCSIPIVSSKNFSLLKMTPEPRMCAEFLCDERSLETETHREIRIKSGHDLQCRDCRDCTDAGFSVCVQSRQSGCACGHSVPNGCAPAPRGQNSAEQGYKVVRLCYSSSLRAPPKPKAVNEAEDVIVTIDPFWTEKYWKDLKLDNLTLFYEFQVKSPEDCDGKVTSLKKGSQTVGYLCTPHLQIDMEEEPEPKSRVAGEGQGNQDYEESVAPEVQFERAVFDGAPNVRFFYKVNAKRERQLNLRNLLVERSRLLDSEELIFNVDDFVEVTTTTTTTTTTTPLPVKKVEIESKVLKDTEDNKVPQAPQGAVGSKKLGEEEKSEKKEESEESDEKMTKEEEEKEEKDSDVKPINEPTLSDSTNEDQDFVEEHLNNGGQLNLIVFVAVITVVLCLILAVITCCFRKHRSAYKKEGQKTATKQLNGYEYKAATQEEHC